MGFRGVPGRSHDQGSVVSTGGFYEGVVHDSMTPEFKLDLLLRLVLGKGQAQPLGSRVQGTKATSSS